MGDKRENINVATLQKVKTFLKKQKLPVFKTDIVKIGVDYNSLKIALKILKVKTNKEGKVSL